MTHPYTQQRTAERNGPLLRAVGDRIAARPDLYDQGEWALKFDCGTYGCVAGHAVDLADGYEIDFTRAENGTTARGPDGHVTPTQIAAEDALGLTEGEVSVLFAGSWRPAGWDPALPADARAGLVRDALYHLANGLPILAVSERPLPKP